MSTISYFSSTLHLSVTLYMVWLRPAPVDWRLLCVFQLVGVVASYYIVMVQFNSLPTNPGSGSCDCAVSNITGWIKLIRKGILPRVYRWQHHQLKIKNWHYQQTVHDTRSKNFVNEMLTPTFAKRTNQPDWNKTQRILSSRISTHQGYLRFDIKQGLHRKSMSSLLTSISFCCRHTLINKTLSLITIQPVISWLEAPLIV